MRVCPLKVAALLMSGGTSQSAQDLGGRDGRTLCEDDLRTQKGLGGPAICMWWSEDKKECGVACRG